MSILTGILSLVAFALITMSNAEDKTQALQQVAEGANQFSSSFFKTVAEAKPGNLISSPLSAAVVLAMAAHGARGETEKQFKQVLHLPSSDSLSQTGYQALIDTLNDVKENKLVLSNKAFVHNMIPVKPAYKDLTETYFRSTTQLVDFSKNIEAAGIINTWVEQSTNNLIKDLIKSDDLGADTALVLVNAVYFKGQWKNKFDPKFTTDMPFHVDNNTVKDVPTMYKQGTFIYGDIPEMDARFVVIPYKGDDLSMVIILPNKVDGLADVEKKLETTSLSSILNRGYSREVLLYLPKFKAESEIDLNDVLQKMGLVDAFDNVKANFSGITDAQQLYVSKVVQKAFIEVNEEGSEAAAATELEIAPFMLMLDDNEFRVNGPFFYAIMARNNIVLFIGRITDFDTAAT